MCGFLRKTKWFLCFATLSILIVQTPEPLRADDDRFGVGSLLRNVRGVPAESPEPAILLPGEPFEGPGPPGVPQIFLRGRYLTKTSKMAILEANGMILVARSGESRTVSFPDGSSITFQVTEISRDRVRLQFLGARSMVLH